MRPVVSSTPRGAGESSGEQQQATCTSSNSHGQRCQRALGLHFTTPLPRPTRNCPCPMQGLPSGPLAECACCARASQACPLHSINIDFNFGLVHNARCGSKSVRLAPPNRRRYLHSAEYDALIADSANAAAADAEADRACSDFNAVKVLARTSETVRAFLAHYWRLLRGSCFAPPTSSKVCTFVCVCGGGGVFCCL